MNKYTIQEKKTTMIIFQFSPWFYQCFTMHLVCYILPYLSGLHNAHLCFNTLSLYFTMGNFYKGLPNSNNWSQVIITAAAGKFIKESGSRLVHNLLLTRLVTAVYLQGAANR